MRIWDNENAAATNLKNYTSKPRIMKMWLQSWGWNSGQCVYHNVAKVECAAFFETHQISLPKVPKIPFKADIETIERIKRKFFSTVQYDFY